MDNNTVGTFGSAAVAKMHNGSFSCLLLLLLAQRSSFLSTFVVSLPHTSKYSIGQEKAYNSVILSKELLYVKKKPADLIYLKYRPDMYKQTAVFM